MQLRCRQHLIQETIPEIYIGMLNASLCGMDDEPIPDNPWVYTEKHKRHGIDTMKKRDLQRMKPDGIECIELFDAMMHRMKSPQRWHGVKRSMLPITQPVCY